ncbi:MAG: ABC transporter ATP-binding protein [Janthinobacterium lividum]
MADSPISAVRHVLAFLIRQWSRERKKVLATATAMCAATAADLLLPLYSGRLIDAIAVPPALRHQAIHLALHDIFWMAILGVLVVVGRYTGFVVISQLTLSLMPRVAGDAFWRVQRFSTDWHASNLSGSSVRRITRGMWAVDLMNATLLLALLPALIVLVGSSLLLGARWPVMGGIVAVGAVLYIGLSVTLSLRYVAPAARLANAEDSRIGGNMGDALTCNSVVKAFGAEVHEDLRLKHVLLRWTRRTFITWMRGTRTGALQLSLLLFLRIAVILCSVLLWWQGRATPGDVTFALTTYFIVQAYLGEVGQHVASFQRGVNEMEEMVALERRPLGVLDRPGAVPLRITHGEICFDHVSFRYGRHVPPLYQDFSVRIAAGERVGLVGRSGSGKTTFVKLLHRLYDLADGRVLVDGQDIALTTQDSVRSQIALVPQDPILFHRSIAENIAYSRPSATREEIEMAARLAHAEGFILSQPEGYGTLVGERGIKLSGGERQRIALARAFLANTPILIMDEATSALDSESEALIQEATERLMVGRTAIIIAHRLSTVRMLDRILVFDHGQVVEEGTHDSLVARPDGTYKRLYDLQALGLVAADANGPDMYTAEWT